MARRQPLNYEQRRLLKIAARMPLASVANLAPVLGLDEERVRRMLGRLRNGGWVASVMRGMTERRQHRFFLTSQTVDLLYTTDHQHPSPREEARAAGLATFHPQGELPQDIQERFALDHNHPPHLEDQRASPFANRMWKLRQGPLPDAVLVLMPDAVRLRHSRRMLDGFPVPVFLAVESEAVSATPDDPVWSPQATGNFIGPRHALDRLDPGGELPVEAEPQRATLPADLAAAGPGWHIPDCLLPAVLRPAEKRAVDLIGDCPGSPSRIWPELWASPTSGPPR